MQAELFGCQHLGLANLLIVTGDPPKAGKYPDVTGVFDTDSVGLTRMVQGYNSGVGLGGDDLGMQSGFVCGAGVNPTFPVPEKEIERAIMKVGAGTEFFVTQPVWDVDLLERFIPKLTETGIPVILGVWPLASFKNAVFLNTEVPGVSIPEHILERMSKHEDREAARMDGIAISREIIERLRPLIQGIQVSAPFGNVKTALEVIGGSSAGIVRFHLYLPFSPYGAQSDEMHASVPITEICLFWG
jgi:homocysteine S-methyltransferase